MSRRKIRVCKSCGKRLTSLQSTMMVDAAGTKIYVCYNNFRCQSAFLKGGMEHVANSQCSTG